MSKNFEDLEIWREARNQYASVHKLTNLPLLSKQFRLKEQLRGAAGSVMDNIAEGAERSGNKEFIQFLYIAKASNAELRSQLYRILDTTGNATSELNEMIQTSIILNRRIASLIKYLRSSGFKGSKFK